MSKKRSKPSYLLHQATGQARVRINGKDEYLGEYGSPESRDRYDDLICEWLARQDTSRVTMTLDDLALLYLDYAKCHYVKDGLPTRLYNVRAAMKHLVNIAGSTRLREFGPRRFKSVREAMIVADYARTTVNDLMAEVKRAVRWAVENEYCTSETWNALRAVRGLQKGKTTAREPKPILPVSQADVNAILPHLSRQLRDMVRLQTLAGCRPTEICILRPCDVEIDGDVWFYRPSSHKTEHHGRERVIFIGPRGQEILRPWLNRDSDSYCFSPAESSAERMAQKRAKRKTKVQPSQVDRSKADAVRKPKSRYTKDSYGRAVRRACMAAGVASWSPNRLRHSRATVIRKAYGLEGAQVTLGHSSANVTQIYAERDLSKGKEIALEIG